MKTVVDALMSRVNSFCIRVLFFSTIIFVANICMSQTPPKKTHASSDVTPATYNQKSRTWVSSFPASQSIFDLYPDPQLPDVVYACTSRGLYKTADGGMTWNMLVALDVSDLILAQSRSSPETMYLSYSVGQSGGLMKSTDRGNSWQSVARADINRTIHALAVDAANPEIVYVLSDTLSLAICQRCILYKSQNGGKTWGEITPNLTVGGSKLGPPVRSLWVDPVNAGRILASVSRTGKVSDLLESRDAGNSWTELAHSKIAESLRDRFRDVEFNMWGTVMSHPVSDKTLIGFNFATGDHTYHSPGLVISLDGTSWKEITIRTGNNKSAAISYINWSKTSDNVIRLATADGLLISNDGGKSWTKSLPYPTHVIAESSTSKRLYAATDFGVFVSPDGGQKWHQASLGLPVAFGTTDFNSEFRDRDLFDAYYEGAGVNLFLAQTFDGRDIYVAGRGGYWTSADIGLTWSWHSVKSDVAPGAGGDAIYPVYSGPNVRQLIAAPDHTIYLNMASQGTFSSGESHLIKIEPTGKIAPIRTPKPPYAIGISQSDSQVIYMSTPGGFSKSEDGGFSWGSFDFSRSLRPSMSDAAITGVRTFAVSAQSSKICYAVVSLHIGRTASDELSLLATFDGGTTWKDVLPDHLISVTNYLYNAKPPIVVDPNNAKTVYLAFNGGEVRTPDNRFVFNGGVFRSTDGGAKWTRLPFQPQEVNDIAVDPKSSGTVYLATNTGIWVSKDAGMNWAALSSGMPKERPRKIFAAAGQVFAEGYYGIYRLTDGGLNGMKSRWAELEENPESDPLGFVALSQPLETPSVEKSGPGTQVESGAITPDSDIMPWLDLATGLTWTNKDNGANVTWSEAVDYCRNMRLRGESGWRLPEIEELMALFDRSAHVAPAPRPELDGLNIPFAPNHIKGHIQLSGLELSDTRQTSGGRIGI